MPRKQRFKPSRKPKPIETPPVSEDAIVHASASRADAITTVAGPAASVAAGQPAVIDAHDPHAEVVANAHDERASTSDSVG